MRNIRKVLFVALACTVAVPASGMAAASGVPGGITLVPGTVVIPGVGGSAVTGTVPFAGTTGSPGVGNFDPGLSPPNRGTPDSGSLYPPTYYPQTALPGTVQSTLPQYAPAAPGGAEAGANGLPNLGPNFIPPAGAVCPSGVSNGPC